jgi:hypothetical protein
MPRFIKESVLSAAVVSCVLMACGGGSSGGAAPATPAAPPGPTVCATFYDDAQLKGATLVSMGPADNSPTVPDAFNDKMSSLAVSAGCTVIVYPDGNYGGQATTFTQTTDVVPTPINDQMSSYKCTCGTGGGK